jgi:hypothetical protein
MRERGKGLERFVGIPIKPIFYMLRPILALLFCNTGSFVSSSEYRKDMDEVLKVELGPMYVGLRHFHARFFRGVADLATISRVCFQEMREGENPQYSEGWWRGWPQDAKQEL